MNERETEPVVEGEAGPAERSPEHATADAAAPDPRLAPERSASAENPAPLDAATVPEPRETMLAPEPAPGATAAVVEAERMPAGAEVPVALRLVEVRDLDWDAVRSVVLTPIADERAEAILARMEERLSSGGPVGLAFEEFAESPGDRALHVREDPGGEIWFVGDLHGDALALEAALQHIESGEGSDHGRIVFLGDLVDDGLHAPEVVLRVFELILERPGRVTIVTGNHDEALRHSEGRFVSSVLPSDFTDWLNSDAEHPWAARLGHLMIAFFERAPRAIFLPDGLLVTHGGVPHSDLHEELEASGDWNDPRVLQDFVWLRAHPRARKRIPNRTTRGSEFGREDFEAFCDLATRLGRPVERLLRGHDHIEERFALFPAYVRNPVLTINSMSHRLPREVFGAYERVPVVAWWVRRELPEVHRICVPAELIREIYPEGAEAPRVDASE